MEVPEKWRGLSKLTGKVIYGTLHKFSFATMIYHNGVYHTVYKSSLAKLAGYDENGNEVYRSVKK